MYFSDSRYIIGFVFRLRHFKCIYNPLWLTALFKEERVLQRFGSPAILKSFGELFRGFSEEVRTRGFPSPSLGGFGFSYYLETQLYVLVRINTT